MRIDSPLMTNAVITGSFSGSFTGVGNFTGLEADSVEFANVLNKPTLVSGSSQIDITSTTGFTSFSSSIAGEIAGLDGEYATDAELNASSSALTTAYRNELNASSSALTSAFQSADTGLSSSLAVDIAINLSSIGTLQTDSATKLELDASSSALTTAYRSELNASSSALTTAYRSELNTSSSALTTAYRSELNVSSSALTSAFQLADTGLSSSLAVDIASNNGRLDTLEGKTLFSGSAQVDLASVTNATTTNVSEGTNLYYTDTRVKTKLNAESVVSGSAQILTLVSIDEDNMASNSDTKLPTQQSVKSYVDAQVSGLVDSAPGALDTLNELAFALGDDANFSTTVSNNIAGKVSQSLEIISGDGLTGGGNLTTSRTLAVGGTAGRITVSADAVDIASTYVGQATITTLGTISAGTWNGSSISTTFTQAKVTSITAGTGITVTGTTTGPIITNSTPNATHTGDVTGNFALTIANDAVTNAKAANMAVSTIKGRATAGTGDPEDLSAAQVRTILNVADGANNYSLPEATSTVLGGIELFSDTDQSVAANGVTATAGRTYGIQLNSAGQAVVNVPWVDTDTNTEYSVGDGGLTQINFTTARRDKLDGIAAGATNVTNNNQLTNGAGYITSAGSISGNAATATKLATARTIAGVSFDGTANISLNTNAITNGAGYITGYTETDTLNSVTARGATTANTIQVGLLRSTGDVVAFYSSDERLKDNLQPLTGALDKVNAMGGYSFDWNDKQDTYKAGEHSIGVKAQEVQAQYPELVKERQDGYLAVDYVKLTAVLIEAVKELAAKVEELENK